MKRFNKKKKLYIILFIIVACIGVGYAYLNATLNINGTAKINHNTWDIHFVNLQINTNSVELSSGDAAAIINPSDNKEVTYTVTLQKPGDFYEFTVDAKNFGTIDGMVESVSSKMGGVEISSTNPLPNYLDYSVTYSDDVPIDENQLLVAGGFETYKVRLEYKKDINISDLPSTIQNISFSFSVTYVQSTDSASNVNHSSPLYSVLEGEATSGGLALEYTGSHHDSFNVNPSKKIYYWYADNDTDGEAIQDKNNVLFAGFCWQIIRTTDTGGVKLLYNGTPNNGVCDASNGDNIGTTKYNNESDSIAYVGYQFNPNTLVSYAGFFTSFGGQFSQSVTYDNGMYTLVNPGYFQGAYSHYRCSTSSSDVTCPSVYFIVYSESYVEISDGRNATEALADMTSSDGLNHTNSLVKTMVDTWYQNNLTSYSSYLEDTIYCNDRNITQLGGWNPDGGTVSAGEAGELKFFDSYSELPLDLSCTQVVDQFSISNTKAKLTYPIGLLTAPELLLFNNSKARVSKAQYWLMSPGFSATSSYLYSVSTYGSVSPQTKSDYTNGVRPAISLKSNVKYSSGDGSKNNPYVIVTN